MSRYNHHNNGVDDAKTNDDQFIRALSLPPSSSSSPSSSSPILVSPDILFAPLPLCLALIAREYADFNLRHAYMSSSSSSSSHTSSPAPSQSSSASRRSIPRLFNSFATSSLLRNFIWSCYSYLSVFALAPIVPGERLAHHRHTPQSARGRQLTDIEASANAADDRLRSLRDCLGKVGECWSSILMWRSELNRSDSSTHPSSSSRSSASSSSSQRFNNPVYDSSFFEALYLLVEYVLEYRFMEQTRLDAQAIERAKESRAAAEVSRQAAKQRMESEGKERNELKGEDKGGIDSNRSDSPSSSSSSSSSSAKNSSALTSSSAASAASITASVDAHWRIIQNELQRLLRSKHFHGSAKRRRNTADRYNSLMMNSSTSSANASSGAAADRGMYSGNGLHHASLSSANALTAINTGYEGASPSYRGSASGGGFVSSSSRGANGGSAGGNGAEDEDDAYVDEADYADDTIVDEHDDDDDARALSHLPGMKRGSIGVLDCLDLRSPLVSLLLPSARAVAAGAVQQARAKMRANAGMGSRGGERRTTHSANASASSTRPSTTSSTSRSSSSASAIDSPPLLNDVYVFGSEPRLSSTARRYQGRLSHSEMRYILSHRSGVEARQEEWKARARREEQEEKEEKEGGEKGRRETKEAEAAAATARGINGKNNDVADNAARRRSISSITDPDIRSMYKSLDDATMNDTTDDDNDDGVASLSSLSSVSSAMTTQASSVASTPMFPMHTLVIPPSSYLPMMMLSTPTSSSASQLIRPTPPPHHHHSVRSIPSSPRYTSSSSLSTPYTIAGSQSARSNRSTAPATSSSSLSSSYASNSNGMNSYRPPSHRSYRAAQSGVRPTIEQQLDNADRPIVKIHGNRISLM